MNYIELHLTNGQYVQIYYESADLLAKLILTHKEDGYGRIEVNMSKSSRTEIESGFTFKNGALEYAENMMKPELLGYFKALRNGGVLRFNQVYYETSIKNGPMSLPYKVPNYIKYYLEDEGFITPSAANPEIYELTEYAKSISI